MIRVLVTGAGGPAGVAAIRSLLRREDVEVYAADMDGWASGLYLVPAARRRLLPRAEAEGFADEVVERCARDGIAVLFATVDAELLPLADRRSDLERVGTVLAAPSRASLEFALDKFALVRRCAGRAPVPETALLDPAGIARDWTFPVIVKPRRGAGSRGVHAVADRAALEALEPDDRQLVQEFLPGAEYSVDVLAVDDRIVAAVPRTRERVDSGVAIAGMTVRDPVLEETASAVALAIGLVGVANVQLRRNAAGVPMLLEVNPRFAGALPLTIAAGVDLPSLALDLALGRPLPERMAFAELANVRFLEDLFLDPAEILRSEHAGHAERAGLT